MVVVVVGFGRGKRGSLGSGMDPEGLGVRSPSHESPFTDSGDSDRSGKDSGQCLWLLVLYRLDRGFGRGSNGEMVRVMS